MSQHSSRGREWNKTVEYIRDKYDHTCQYGYGGCTVDSDTTVDHILPKSKGGTDDEYNLTLACRSCNGKKRDNILTRAVWYDHEWINN